MAVNEHVDTGHSVQHVDGAVAGGLGVNAQVPQADDVVTASGFQGIHFGLGQLHHVLAADEGHALDLGGVGLGGGLRGLQAEDTDLLALGGGEDGVAVEGGGPVIPDVGRQNWEVGLGRDGLQIGVAVVKFVVAHGGGVIAGGVHQFDGRLALGGADGWVALNIVAGIHQQGVGPGGGIALFYGGELGVPGDAAVHVVGVQDDDVTGQVLRRGGGRLRRADGDRQGEEQGQGKREGKKLVS